MSKSLNPEKALIWRIIHRDNLEWILQHGVYASSSEYKSDDWVSIGSEELIDKRSKKEVPIAPGGMLSDYVPFYFTPFSPMLYNIKTGRGGVVQRNNDEIIILVSSLYDVNEAGLNYVYTDSHAYSALANYYSDLNSIRTIDWDGFYPDFTDTSKTRHNMPIRSVHDQTKKVQPRV
ncbi:UNVERIFIED_ORG: uncharacterized protein DUF4433 [Idiomarina abyssalis]|jgi:hypothetical protein|uniref:Uncharacterized conserved protein n=1 Tax=Idiomarina loihiensis (strain ATCC BAA-735 / DSM 15497 / L2-TR) TaxID=283942 RepID=Q5R0U9_IDILO|nr:MULTISPECIES: DUF4433 domain-containing protein [Idiomarina]AAV82450.1 Uncharacterized conserved protein [Idiomarina loihiensis L2TR]AGM36487.1 hypothetical protein K734_08120 [Idiomarina loihiensis GSL 199]TDO53887.1 uncharacterized protein DUF4433 [Idiomarina sp. 017G]